MVKKGILGLIQSQKLALEVMIAGVHIKNDTSPFYPMWDSSTPYLTPRSGHLVRGKIKIGVQHQYTIIGTDLTLVPYCSHDHVI